MQILQQHVRDGVARAVCGQLLDGLEQGCPAVRVLRLAVLRQQEQLAAAAGAVLASIPPAVLRLNACDRAKTLRCLAWMRCKSRLDISANSQTLQISCTYDRSRVAVQSHSEVQWSLPCAATMLHILVSMPRSRAARKGRCAVRSESKSCLEIRSNVQAKRNHICMLQMFSFQLPAYNGALLRTA